MDVIVIGAGASGIIAALKCSKKNNVKLIDSNNLVGKKITLTGNGKCNYWNSDININKYNSNNLEELNIILNNKDKVLEYLTNLGIYPYIKDGYYYPYNREAKSIRELFERNINYKNIEFINNSKVLEIKKENNKFIVKCENNQYNCDKLIIAVGGLSYPKTGSDGSLYDEIKKLGHTFNKLSPSLVKLKSNNKYLKELENIRANAILSLEVDGKIIKEEKGELQICKDSLSGICVFNLSSLASKYLDRDLYINIDFIPNTNALELLNDRNKIIKKPVKELLETILDYRLIKVILNNSNIKEDEYLEKIDNKRITNLINNIKSFKVKIIDLDNYEHAQVTKGGVKLSEINPYTMESKIIKNLYIIGEVLDVDGICGGYNLAFSFITGFLAGDQND